MLRGWYFYSVSEQTTEKIQLLPDVKVQEHVIDEETATLGAVSALELIDQGVAKRKSGIIWELYLDESKQQSSLPAEFTACADALLSFAGVRYPSTRLVIMSLENSEFIPMHQDFFNGSRSLLTLAGFKDVRFANPQLEAAFTQITLGPGDAYTMTFREDKSSQEHEVEYCLGDNIVVYLNHH